MSPDVNANGGNIRKGFLPSDVVTALVSGRSIADGLKISSRRTPIDKRTTAVFQPFMHDSLSNDLPDF